MSHRVLIVALSIVAALAPTDLNAQSVSAGSGTDRAAAFGPRAEAARLGVAPAAVAAEDAAAGLEQRRRGLGEPMALMIVGGAALLAGLIIGDDAGTVVAIGGAIIGLYGLYQYLR
jgi:hypothetical protein